MFPLYFHYEDVSRQDPLLKPNHANVMEVPGLCEIRVVPKAPYDFIIKNGKLAMESTKIEIISDEPVQRSAAQEQSCSYNKKKKKKKEKFLLKKKFRPTTIRRFLLITLSHCEARNVSQLEVMNRLKRVFLCTSILVSKEPHQSGGYHYHIGLQNSNASKNNYARLVREAFPEFEGMQLDVQAKKGWGPICAYVTKTDKSPLIWGEYSLEQVLELAEAFRSRRKSQGLAKKGQGIENNPSGGFKKQPRRFVWIWKNTLLCILSYQTITYILNWQVPAFFLFIYEKFQFLFDHLQSLWEESGADPQPGLPSDIPSSSKTNIIIFLCIGLAIVVVGIIYLNNSDRFP